MVLAGGQLRVGGQVISSPADVVNTIPNTPLLLLASAALLILTIAVNLMANFVAPATPCPTCSRRSSTSAGPGWSAR